MKPIIIIGSGMAGISLAREFRKLDGNAPVIMITADEGGFYAKPNLSNAFAQNKLASQLRAQSASQVAEQLKVSVLQNTTVLAIDAERQTINTSIGEFEYRSLVLAVGANAIRLPIAGNATDKVYSINHLDDYQRFRAQLGAIVDQQKTVRVAILGAGLIGCEFADDLIGAGFEVHLIDPNQGPLAALLPEAISTQLQNALHAKGVQMHLGTTALEINNDGVQTVIHLANQETVRCDIVLSAVGLRPNLQLAQLCDPTPLKVDKGILVDTYGETSAKQIFALGDCAQYMIDSNGSSAVMPYIAPILSAARSIAKTLNGEATPIDIKPSPIIVKTPSCPIALIAPNIQELSEGSWSHELNAGHIHVSRFTNKDGKLRGFAMTPQDAKLRTSLSNEIST